MYLSISSCNYTNAYLSHGISHFIHTTSSHITMSRLLLLFLITFVRSEHFNKTCDGFQANFDTKEVVGTWHVVAIIPDKLFPERDINCYKVEFSETDEVRFFLCILCNV